MSILGRALGIEQRNAPPQPDINQGGGIPSSNGWWSQGMVWNPAPSSTSVTDEQALKVSAVYACLRLLSDAVSTMPLDTFRRIDGTRIPFRPRPTWLDFHDPAPRRIDFLTQVVMSLLTDGNAFIAVLRDQLGSPVALWVLDPQSVSIRRESGVVIFTVDGTDFTPLDIVHIPWLVLPGRLRGLSPLGAARETVAVGAAAQRFGAQFFAGGALPGAVIEVEQKLSEEAAKQTIDQWRAQHEGIKQGGVGLLSAGAKLNKIGINPEDAQFLETRKFTVSDVARIFGVPPHLIGDASNSTSWGSGLAEQNVAFGQLSLTPIVERVEAALDWILTTDGLADVFVKLNMDARFRGSLKDRYAAYDLAIAAGFMTVNEVRRLEDMAPVDGGDVVSPRSPSLTVSTGGAA